MDRGALKLIARTPRVVRRASFVRREKEAESVHTRACTIAFKPTRVAAELLSLLFRQYPERQLQATTFLGGQKQKNKKRIQTHNQPVTEAGPIRLNDEA